MKRWLAMLTILALALGPCALAEEVPEPVPATQDESVESKETPSEERSYEEPPAEEEPAREEPVEDEPSEEEPSEEEPSEEELLEDEPSRDEPGEAEPFEEEYLEDGDVIEDAGEGYSAAQVEHIQRWLIALKYLEEGHVTGEYDAETAGAVAAFQGDNDLDATGECDAATYDLLKELGQAAIDAESGGETGGDDDDDGDVIVVSDVQAWLVILGYLDESQLTGEYDDATDAAVSRFQADNGLEVTGECDPVTLALLASMAEAASREETGYTAEEIKQIQAWLAALGYLSKDGQTGIMDEATVAAIAAFQVDCLMAGTGVLDQSTYQLLKELGEAASAASGGGQGSGGGSGGGTGGSGASGAAAGSQDERLNGVTPGAALTSTHASGSKDVSRYGAIGRSGGLKDLGISLRIGESVDDLVRVNYNAAVRDDTLALQGSEERAVQRWTFDGLTLRTLSRSGIERMTFAGVSFDTRTAFEGAVYDALRALGYTENTFKYTVTVEGGEASVVLDIKGRRFTATPGSDGAYTLTEEAN